MNQISTKVSMAQSRNPIQANCLPNDPEGYCELIENSQLSPPGPTARPKA
jgi:hypothetical protein